MNPIDSRHQNGYWMPTVILDRGLKTCREEIVQIFDDRNIDARLFFWPLSTLDFIDQEVDTPVSFDLSTRGLNLPSYHDITEKDQLRVVEVLKNLS